MSKFSVEHNWTIENFCIKYDQVDVLESPEFTDTEHDMKFRVLFYPQLQTTLNAPNLYQYKLAAACVQSRNITGNKWTGESKVDFTIKVKNFSCFLYGSNQNSYALSFHGEYNQNPKILNYVDDVDPINLITEKYMLPISYSNEIVLECKINVSYKPDSFSSTFCPWTVDSNNLHRVHIEKMRSILATGHQSDITLKCGNQELKAHKLLLSLHSPVFEAMFSHTDTKEAAEKKVVIDDVSAEAMQGLLTYIYTGEMEIKGEEQTLELLIATDKYQLNSLKVEYENHLSSMLTTESVCSLLLYADMHNAPVLRENCLLFITFNSTKMISNASAAWKQFEDSASPELLKELLRRMCSKE